MGRARTTGAALAATALAVAMSSCSSSGTPPRARPTPSAPAVVTVVAAGDIACGPDNAEFHPSLSTVQTCGAGGSAQVAASLRPTAVLALGDLQYECGGSAEWKASYDLTWGRFRSITRPVVGNHEYGISCGRMSAGPYFDYWGAAAGERDHGWYSFDLGGWHLVALNSECDLGSGSAAVGGCQAGSPQEMWLRADLAAHPARCTLAFWHEPRWSSSKHGDALQMTAVWNDLVAAHADVVLNGHDHVYERFDPLGAATGPSSRLPEPIYENGTLSPNGVRQFVVGTGGRDLYQFPGPKLTGEVVRYDQALGVLQLSLRPAGYDWEFHSAPTGTVVDHGVGTCN